ncbi:MAG: hypothetical protein JKY95_00655 [Planctomycetaceae bacterium]|nr:hypothetical protein [Planctomycetaceae bacterium]
MKNLLLCAAVACLGLAVVGTTETEAGRRHGNGRNYGYRTHVRRSPVYYQGYSQRSPRWNIGVSYGGYGGGHGYYGGGYNGGGYYGGGHHGGGYNGGGYYGGGHHGGGYNGGGHHGGGHYGGGYHGGGHHGGH